MNVRFATFDDTPAIQEMANVAFRQTYANILSPDQLDYMMDWMYSFESLKTQIGDEGKDFFIVSDDKGTPVGYMSIEEEGTTSDNRPLLHLQKIYVMPNMHGTGIGRFLFSFLREFLSTRHPEGCRIELNVNRENSAVHFYEKMGMHRDRQGDFPIGNGYYMNDYIYAMDLQPA